MSKKLKAFTLAETLIVLCVIGVIVALTAATTLSSSNTKEKKILSLSQSFYSNIENTYQQILFSETSNASITGIKDANGDGSIDSSDLRYLFEKYMDGEDTPCSSLKVNSGLVSEYLTDSVCATFPPNIIAGFHLDTTCNLEIYTKEYLSDSHETKTMENACGRIIYGLRDSKGQFTYDLFTIALGKRRVK